MIARGRLVELLDRFPKLSIGLVGDLFLDRYLDIDAELVELSIETGLEAYQVTGIRNNPGALGTVINNLAALGVGRLVPLSVIGDDGQAFDLLKELGRLPVDCEHIIRDPARKTPTYTKPMKRDSAGVWRELNRLDLRNRAGLSAATEQLVIEHLDQVWIATDGLIVLDQVNEEGWGVIGPRVREHLAKLAVANPRKIMFSDSRAQVSKFRGGWLKPNLSECLRGIGRPATDSELLACEPGQRIELARQAATILAQQTQARVFCTLGPQGILVVDAESGTTSNRGEPVLVPGYPVEGPIDPVGAGDSATSGMVASLLAGANAIEAAAVGNLVASITVTKLGTTGTASPRQVLDRWDGVHRPSNK